MGALVKIPTIIIDDEALIRSLIRKSVDWEALGFTIVAEADNSEDALRLVREMEILLAIVDINIPFINGLQLSKQLRQINSNLSIIILTGYEEFSYAQEAIRIGVSNYLLKPLNVKELKNSLKQVHLQIVERQQDDFIETLCSQLSLEGVLKAKEEFLRILIKQSNLIPLSTLQKGAQLFGLNLTDDSVRFFQLYVIQVTEVEARGRLIDHLRLSHFEKTFPLLLHTTIDYE
ncbi:MAG: response regulator, partial [Spirochaetales bacterium]|nr:response regulator [Spirochaetales bacterium]